MKDGVWVAHLVVRLTLDLGSGHHLRAASSSRTLSPMLGGEST